MQKLARSLLLLLCGLAAGYVALLTAIKVAGKFPACLGSYFASPYAK